MQNAQTANDKPFDATTWRIGIVVSKFNSHITDQLYQSALARAHDYGISPQNIDTITVAGAIEIPLALQAMAQTKRYRALLAVGCVIRGATPHFDYVCRMAADGILAVQLKYDLPIAMGVLTCEDEAQAQERAHLGGEHLDAALQLAKSLAEITTT